MLKQIISMLLPSTPLDRAKLATTRAKATTSLPSFHMSW